jgi:PAS domain S-box-containing protein
MGRTPTVIGDSDGRPAPDRSGSATDGSTAAPLPQALLEFLERSVDAVIVTDARMRIIAWNDRATTLYGWTAAEARGSDITDLVVPEPLEEASREINARLALGDSWSGNFRLRRRDGSEFVARITNAAVRGHDGEVAAVIGVSYDLHDGSAARAVPATLRRVVDETVDGPRGVVIRHGAQVALVRDAPLDLSPTESALLDLLVTNAGAVLTREEIARHVWGYEVLGPGNFVEAAISRLRRKLRDAGRDNLVQTVRGRGYTVR